MHKLTCIPSSNAGPGCRHYEVTAEGSFDSETVLLEEHHQTMTRRLGCALTAFKIRDAATT